MCLCNLFSAKTAWQLVNRKANFLQNESIRIDSHNESNRMYSNRELEYSTGHAVDSSVIRSSWPQNLQTSQQTRSASDIDALVWDIGLPKVEDILSQDRGDWC